ncbi:hypothetical protein D3C84_647660 [compost metagenome]
MHIKIQPRRTKYRHEITQKAIKQVQTRKLGTSLNQSVVIGGEDIQTVTDTRATSKAHQKRNQMIKCLLTSGSIRRGYAGFAQKNGF